MKKMLIILIFFLIRCNINDICLPSMKIIHSELHSTSFSFQYKFSSCVDANQPEILNLRKKYPCLLKLIPKFYANKNNYIIIIFKDKNKNGVIVILNNGIEKLIKINDFRDYHYKGFSIENETLSIFLTYKSKKQKINFKAKNDYVFWNSYEF